MRGARVGVVMVTIALVGSGRIAEEHALAYADVADADVVGVASTDDPGGFAERLGLDAAAFEDETAMLDALDPAVVDVCPPVDRRAASVERAVERGCDVFCEGPLARTLADAERVRDGVADAGVTFAVGNALRFAAPYVRARELVEAGEVGTPGVARATRVGPRPAGTRSGGDDDDAAAADGVLFERCVHDFDYLRWVLGDVARVHARRAAWGTGGEGGERVAATLRFVGGAVGHVEGSWERSSSRPLDASFEVAGDDGLVEYDGATAAFGRYAADGGDASTGTPTGASPRRRELDAFLGCVADGGTPRATADDGVAAVRVALAAAESVECGGPVRVAEVEA